MTIETRETGDLWDNPMGTEGFEYIEYTSEDTAALGRLFEQLGFTAVASHRAKAVTRYRHGDINFIEARSQLRAGYWRHFVGIGAVAQEFVAATRPDARIIPLYYTTPLRREYMNRVLALGWIPSLTYCDVIGSRPFFQAAYELGNCTPVPARYSPDWKRDATTQVESYAVQRRGDNGYLLSFIHHGEEETAVGDA